MLCDACSSLVVACCSLCLLVVRGLLFVACRLDFVVC